MPGVAVEGVGGVGLPTPPVAVGYQSKVFPVPAVAVRGVATSPWQYTTGVGVTVGDAGKGFIVIVIDAVFEQLVDDSVPVTVYVAVVGIVVLLISVAVTGLPEVALKPVAGDHA